MDNDAFTPFFFDPYNIDTYGMNPCASQPLGVTRRVELGKAVFQFAMPEDFSLDMPAEPLVERLDIDDPDFLQNPEDGILIRRWWDIEDPGFLGRKLGTVMMSIGARKAANNSRRLVYERPFDLSNHVEFLMMLNEYIRLLYPKNKRHRPASSEDSGHLFSIPELAVLLGPDLLTFYQKEWLGGQMWTRYCVFPPHASIIVNYALPLNSNVFLEASFNYSPSVGVVVRRFLDVASKKMDCVRDRFYLKSSNGSKPFD